jgi:hypothetical protein
MFMRALALGIPARGCSEVAYCQASDIGYGAFMIRLAGIALGMVVMVLLAGCAQVLGIEELSSREGNEQPPDDDAMPPDAPPAVSECIDPSRLHLGTFTDNVMPMLEGRVDWNDIQSGRITTGCARQECHGTSRGPDGLYISADDSPQQNLARVACFIDLEQPSRSRILTCALNLSSCGETHPGLDVFFGTDDRNYQILLSYIYSIKAAVVPYDYAFYVRRINPIFDDPKAVMDGALSLSCSSTSCHFSPAIGAVSDAGSHLSILAGAVEEEELRHNYFVATSMLHFPDPPQSSLFLYPTGQNANPSNDLATGLSHPGGLDFSTTSSEARAILEWAGGLRLDDQGAQRNWLVAGSFAAFDVTSKEIDDEESIQPRIFMRSGQPAEFHHGRWDGFFATSSFIDLDDEAQGFHRTEPTNRLAYAVAYLFNTGYQDIDAVITVTSPNAVQIFAGGEPIAAAPGQGASVEVRLPAGATTGHRIMIKVFQSAQDTQFGFTAKIAEDSGQSLSDNILVKLEPEGGT